MKQKKGNLFSLRISSQHNLIVRARVQRSKLLRAHPLLQRFAFLQGLKLALPDFTNEYQSAIRTPQPFFFSQLQRALAYLRSIVLDPNDVSALWAVDVLNADVTAKHRLTNFSRRAAKFTGPRLVAVLVGLAFFALQNMRHVELKTRMVVVVHWHSPGQMIAIPLPETQDVG